jgi:hypothetical protein
MKQTNSGSLNDKIEKQHHQQCACVATPQNEMRFHLKSTLIAGDPDIPANFVNCDSCEDTKTKTFMAIDNVDLDSDLDTFRSCSGDPA